MRFFSSIPIHSKLWNYMFQTGDQREFQSFFKSNTVCTLVIAAATFFHFYPWSRTQPSYCIVHQSKIRNYIVLDLIAWPYIQCRKLLSNRQHPNETIQTKIRRRIFNFLMNTHWKHLRFVTSFFALLPLEFDLKIFI